MLFSLSVNGNNREVKRYLESDNWIVQNLNNALETWNSKLSEIWQLLTQSPETFKGGDIWSVMLTIHDALKGIGYGLLVLFFAISVVKTCSSYLDVKKPEHAVKLFIRFALAKGAVGYGLELMMALFSVIQGMVSTIMQNSGFGGDSDVIELPAEMVEKIESVGLLDSIPLWIVTLLGSLFITVLSFIMILTVYGRMFKLYMYTAIAPIPIATFAGEPTQNIGKNFVRSYAGVCMEGVIIALACIIFSVFAASPPAIADSSLSAVNIVWNYVAELIFNLLVLVGAIKAADRIVKEILDRPENFDNIYRLTSDDKLLVSWRALWICDKLCRQKPEWLIPFREELTGRLMSCGHDGSKRLLLSILYHAPATKVPSVALLNF